MLISMLNMLTSMKKQVLVRGVDEDVYRRAKSAAALEGVSMGFVVSEALRAWVEGAKGDMEVRQEVRRNVQYVTARWEELQKHRGRAVVVSGGKLQGVYSSLEEARSFSSRFRVALAFVVDEKPRTGELELGPDLEIQR
jgi:hypothetical protein